MYKATLRNFAANAAAHPKHNEDHVVGVVERNAPPHIVGYTRVVNSQEVRKNLNTHGNPNRPVRGQPPITNEDFNAIPSIVETGRYRVLGDSGSRKPQRIEYQANVGGIDYVYTETVGADRRRVALQSFYRK